MPDFSDFVSGGAGFIVAAVLFAGSVIWYMSSQISRVNDHEKRIVALETANNIFNSKLNEIAVAVGRIEASLQILLKEKS